MNQSSGSNLVLLEKLIRPDNWHFGQFNLRGDFWSKYLLKYRKLKLWKRIKNIKKCMEEKEKEMEIQIFKGIMTKAWDKHDLINL